MKQKEEIKNVIDDYDLLNENAAMDILSQFRESQYYNYYKVDENVFYVRRYVSNEKIEPDSAPRFDRTRTVRVEQNIEGKNFLQCSCGYYDRTRRPCRHMFTILDRYPNATDCDIRNFKMYSAHFGENENFSDICNSHFSNNTRKGMLINLPLLTSEHNQRNDIAFFENALRDTILLNPTFDVFEDEVCLQDVADDLLVNEVANGEIMEDINAIINTNKSDNLKNKNREEYFNRLMPLFSQTCEQITNQDQFIIVRKKLQEAHKEILSGNAEKVNKSANNDKTGVASLPILDRRKKDTRKKPYHERY